MTQQQDDERRARVDKALALLGADITDQHFIVLANMRIRALADDVLALLRERDEARAKAEQLQEAIWAFERTDHDKQGAADVWAELYYEAASGLASARAEIARLYEAMFLLRGHLDGSTGEVDALEIVRQALKGAATHPTEDQ